MQTNKEIIRRLKEVIEMSGLTTQEFCARLGDSSASLAEVLNGQSEELPGNVELDLWIHFQINPEWLETGAGPERTKQYPITDPNEHRLIMKFRNMTPKEQRRLLKKIQELQELYEKEKKDETG